MANTETKIVFGKKKIPGFKIEENMSYTEEGTWPGSAIWKSNNTPAGSTVSTFNEYEDSYGWGGPNHMEREAKVQNMNLENLDIHEVVIDLRRHIYYCTNQNTWWFSDETSQLNGPFVSYNLAALRLEEYYDYNIAGTGNE